MVGREAVRDNSGRQPGRRRRGDSNPTSKVGPTKFIVPYLAQHAVVGDGRVGPHRVGAVFLGAGRVEKDAAAGREVERGAPRELELVDRRVVVVLAAAAERQLNEVGGNEAAVGMRRLGCK